MARKGENIFRRNTGVWEARYIKERVNGKIRYGYITGRSYEEVYWRKQEKLKELAASVEADLAIQPDSPDDRLLMAHVAKEWLKTQERLLKKNTLARYHDDLNRYILPEFGERYIDDITRDEAGRFGMRLYISGGINGQGCGPNTVSGILSVMRLVFKYARDVHGAYVANLENIVMPKDEERLRVFTEGEQKVIEEFLLENLTPSNLGIYICLNTGIRLGEVCALQWKNVLSADRLLDICSTMVRVRTLDNPNHKTKVEITPPKTRCSVRSIPIPDDLFELMMRMRRTAESFLLTGKEGVFVEPRTMENRFRAILQDCGIDHANFHTTRHTFATRWVEAGGDVKSLSRILGHSSVQMTMNRYVHPTIDQMRKGINNVSARTKSIRTEETVW